MDQMNTTTPVSGQETITVEATDQGRARRLALLLWADQGRDVVRILSVDLVRGSMSVHGNAPVWAFDVTAILGVDR